jgi:Zn-dependent protease with chaperone function
MNHLWLVAPLQPHDGWWRRLYQPTHPPLEERVDALRQL